MLHHQHTTGHQATTPNTSGSGASCSETFRRVLRTRVLGCVDVSWREICASILWRAPRHNACTEIRRLASGHAWPEIGVRVLGHGVLGCVGWCVGARVSRGVREHILTHACPETPMARPKTDVIKCTHIVRYIRDQRSPVRSLTHLPWYMATRQACALTDLGATVPRCAPPAITPVPWPLSRSLPALHPHSRDEPSRAHATRPAPGPAPPGPSPPSKRSRRVQDPPPPTPAASRCTRVPCTSASSRANTRSEWARRARSRQARGQHASARGQAARGARRGAP